MRTIFRVILTVFTAGTGTDGRIDLAEFGRVVQYTGDSSEKLQVKSLERGVDGWEAWKGPDGQYMIGLEFDEPRDLKEVGIEFRHAIADRHLVQVQYFKQHDDPFQGEWVRAKAEWWAGDRDVNFGFMPYSQELAEAAGTPPKPPLAKGGQEGGRDARPPGQEGGQDARPPGSDVSYRRTYRIRFLLGQRELPPVRYVHAYGPRPVADGEFDLRFEPGSAVRLPLEVSVVNGFVLQGKDRVPVMEMGLDNEPASLAIRFARGDLKTPTRTIVTLRNAADPQSGVSFVPAEAAQFGSIRVPSLGVTISHRGGAASQPVESQPAQTRASQEPSLSSP